MYLDDQSSQILDSRDFFMSMSNENKGEKRTLISRDIVTLRLINFVAHSCIFHALIIANIEFWSLRSHFLWRNYPKSTTKFIGHKFTMLSKNPKLPDKNYAWKSQQFSINLVYTSRLIVRIAIVLMRLLMAIEITGADASNFIVLLGVNSFAWLVREITDCLLALW